MTIQHPYSFYTFHWTTKAQMLHTSYYITVLINCWDRARNKSIGFCRVVHSDGTLCKVFYFYKLVLWKGKISACQVTIKQFLQLCVLSQIQAKNKILRKWILSEDKTAYRRRAKKQSAQLKTDSRFLLFPLVKYAGRIQKALWLFLCNHSRLVFVCLKGKQPGTNLVGASSIHGMYWNIFSLISVALP